MHSARSLTILLRRLLARVLGVVAGVLHLLLLRVLRRLTVVAASAVLFGAALHGAAQHETMSGSLDDVAIEVATSQLSLIHICEPTRPY